MVNKRHRISMQGCFVLPLGHVEFVKIDKDRRSFLGLEPTPIILLVNGNERALNPGTLNQWLYEHPTDKGLREAYKAYWKHDYTGE